jgi:uncharacterized protein DUF397
MDLRWRRSTYSSGSGNQEDTCVEVADLGAGVAVRDSKNPGPRLDIPRSGWRALLRTVPR